MAEYVARLPGPYVGDRWATFRSPWGLKVERKVSAWGQIATPDARPDLVAYEMWNHLPMKGKGWTYIKWRIEPYGPKSDFPTTGVVTDEERKTLQEKLSYLAVR